MGAQREGIGCLQPGRGLLSEPSHLAILSWTFNLHKCEKLVSIVYKSPRLRFSVIVAAHSCLPLWDLMDCNTPLFSVLHYLPEFTPTHVHRVSDAIQPSHSLLPPSPPALNLSQHQGIFQWVGSSHQVVKVLSFSISSSGLISFRMYWFDLLAVQGTLQSLLQHHSSKASILWCSDFFMVQVSHLYMTTGKTIALTLWAFVNKMMSLFFNMLSF